jgi:hypothetical protein
MHGIYRDQVWTGDGRMILDRGWRCNTITSSAWPLVAGLLRNDPALGGILYAAVGCGDSQWDSSRIVSDPWVTSLHDEVARQPIPFSDITYLDGGGSSSETPTNRIEITVRFSWSEQSQTLRELGLYGGDATELRDSGFLINHVIHPRIDLDGGATLQRRLRLTLTPQVPVGWLEAPPHWLGDLQIRFLEGVGTVFAKTLRKKEIDTIAAFARRELGELQSLGISIPETKLAQLRAKARLLLRTAADLTPVAELDDYRAREVLLTPAKTLADETGAAIDEIRCLKEQIGVLELTLDRQVLERTKVGKLVRSD